MLAKILNYLKEVRAEMGKVNWLRRDEVLKYTVLVIVVSIVVAIYLGGLDLIFTTLLQRVLTQ